MDALRRRHTLHGCTLLFLFITSCEPGSTCKPPSSPLCFRKGNDDVDCKWNMKTTERDVTYDIVFDYNRTKKTFPGISNSFHTLSEDELIMNRPADVWVEAHVGNSSCRSNKTSVILQHTVKYDAPKQIAMSWSKGDLILVWTDQVKMDKAHPALAEVRFQARQRPREPWEYRMANTSSNNSKYRIKVENLLEHTAYRFQIRYRSTWFLNPLWSDWSSLVTVPAELDQQPVVTVNTKVVNGTREVTLTWGDMLPAASVKEVTYSITDTQSSSGCFCKQRRHSAKSNPFTIYVSYSAVNISVVARNAAGVSPAAVVSVGLIATAGLKICDTTLLGKQVKKRTCLELYEFQDGDWRPAEAINSTTGIYSNITLKDYIYYLYFEHRCLNRTPRTDKMCVFYHKEGVPLTEPLDFTVFGESSTSVNLSWKAIPIGKLRGFLSHYKLCSLQLHSEQTDEVCYNVSAFATEHCLVNLTPGSKYNISLAAVTREGEGPQVIRIVNTLPENMTVLLWILGVLFAVFLISTLCTCMLRQIKRKLFPPVPTPVISDFTPSQKMLESPEEVDELTLHELHEERKLAPESAEETLVRGEWYEDMDEDTEEDSTELRVLEHYGDGCLKSTDRALKQSSLGAGKVDLANEIAMLIYRNGLVFDVKTDSS